MSRGKLLVLVPDSDAILQNVLAHAAVLAGAMDLSLQLLAALPEPPPRGRRTSPELDRSLQWLRLAGAELYLREAGRSIFGVPVDVKLAVAPAGSEDRIAALADDAVIVAMVAEKKCWPWRRPGIGELLRRRGRQSMLLVDAHGYTHDHRSLRRILVPIVETASCESALMHAAKLAMTTGARLTLVRVVPWMVRPWYVDDPAPALAAGEIATRAAEAHLAQTCSRLPAQVRADPVVYRGGELSGVLRCALESDADLVVLGEPPRGVLGSLLGGDMASRLVHAGVPVLTIAPPTSIPGAARARPQKHPAS